MLCHLLILEGVKNVHVSYIEGDVTPTSPAVIMHVIL